jgi:hypothetical protein
MSFNNAQVELHPLHQPAAVPPLHFHSKMEGHQLMSEADRQYLQPI